MIDADKLLKQLEDSAERGAHGMIANFSLEDARQLIAEYKDMQDSLRAIYWGYLDVLSAGTQHDIEKLIEP